MSKKKVNVKDLVGRHQTNCNRIQEIADACESEQRERNAEEDDEYHRLTRENEVIRMKLQAVSTPDAAEQTTPTQQLREALRSGALTRPAPMTFALRDVSLMTTAGLADTGIIPVQEEEMLKPLRAGLIWDKVGISIRTGLTGGQLRWPMHTKTTASWMDEGERVGDSKIDFDKLTVSPRRLACAIPVTREELESSQGVVERVIREEMPAAVIDLINECMFTTSDKITIGGVEKDRKVHGPLVYAAANNKVEFAGEVPTRRELIKMKAAVTKQGIALTHPCWVMTEDMKAGLEDTKVDAGSGRFVCENDTILGYPVFTTPYIGDGNVAFGDWSYQAGGFFGPINLGVDPYTLMRQNADDFVLNAHFATATLRKEAFVFGTKKGA